MDISFKTAHGRFNYRVSAVILRDNCLLTMQDNLYSYSYLPGGRVKMGESAESALRREMIEELHAPLPVIRPLWICEDFFTEEDTLERFHEICVYFLVDGSALPEEAFSHPEGGRINRFSWTPVPAVQGMHLYPEFIRKSITSLPDHLEWISEYH